jgi:hypothetical protein
MNHNWTSNGYECAVWDGSVRPLLSRVFSTRWDESVRLYCPVNLKSQFCNLEIY